MVVVDSSGRQHEIDPLDVIAVEEVSPLPSGRRLFRLLLVRGRRVVVSAADYCAVVLVGCAMLRDRRCAECSHYEQRHSLPAGGLVCAGGVTAGACDCRGFASA